MPQIQYFRDFISLPSPSASPYHIFFLPGNPGLVEYYAKFLSLLHSTLNQAPSTTQFNIAGCSYAGFETGPLSSEEDNDEHKLYDITEQVTHSLARLQEYINSTTTTTDNKTKPKVILIGHSFGTFVIAELMKRLHTPSSTEEKQQNYEIIGNILLFPPIPDLAKSPRGVKAAGIAKWKYLPSIMSYVAKAVYNLPLSWSNAIVRYMTSFPSDALYTTRMFFGSRTGVAQALHLVKFEFDEIKLSRWEASFRSIASYQKQEAGQFPIRIFFGANDHWVDNELRDAFIYKYCDPSGPLAFDKEGLDLQARIDPSRDGDEESVVIPHDFSIGHSEHVVPYVAEYVEEIIGSR